MVRHVAYSLRTMNALASGDSVAEALGNAETHTRGNNDMIVVATVDTDAPLWRLDILPRHAASCGAARTRSRKAFAPRRSAERRLSERRPYRVQADALEIESQAKRRLADEYDAAQQRGEVRAARRAGKTGFADQNIPSVTELGLSRQSIHHARIIRDAERSSPGIVRRAHGGRCMQRPW